MLLLCAGPVVIPTGVAGAQQRAPSAKAPPKAEPAPEGTPAPTSAAVEDLASSLSIAEAAIEAQKADMAYLTDKLTEEREARQSLQADLERALEAIKTAPPMVSAARMGLSLGGFLQADVPFRQSSRDELNGSTGDLLNQNRFYLRRARVRLSLNRTYLEGAFELDANTVNGPLARPVNAEASVKLPSAEGQPPLLMATIGLFKTPFGFEIGESDRDRLFMERSTTEQALFPGEYDGGVKLSGGWHFIRYALAWMNGEPLGEKTFPGRDPNKLKDLVGRLGVDVGVVDGVSVRGGFSALAGHGFHKGAPATKDVLQWRDVNTNRTVDPGEISVIPGSPPTPSFNFDRQAFGADAGVGINWPGLGRTTVYGELYLAQSLDRALLPYEPSAPSAPAVRELGWYAAVTQQVGRHVMVGVRYDEYNPDRDATETAAGKLVTRNRRFDSLALVAALVSPFGRLMVEWDRNRNHLGRDLLGRPTNLRDNAFIVRGQVNF